MSTKNLARTVIEGGRYWGATWMCRYENGASRADTRTALRRLVVGRADADETVIPRPRRIGRQFHDKLSASERWLGAQVGRPWSLVQSDLLRKFDPRTTAGRHIVFCHMLPSISHEGEVDCGTFLVDRHGLLRRVPWRRYRRPGSPAPLPRPEREIAAWLGGRRVGTRGGVLFWFIPTAWGGYRQQHILENSDAAFWLSLPDWFRACHDSFVAPTRYSKPLS